MERYPLIDEVSMPVSAAGVFRLLDQQPFAFFLDSGMNEHNLGRYSFLGSEPFLVLRSCGRNMTLLSQGQANAIEGNPFEVLDDLLNRYRLQSPGCSTPLVGGAVGYFSYDLCHLIEKVPSTAVDDLRLPECLLAFYDTVLIFDHQDGRVYIASTGFPEQREGKRLRNASARLKEVKARLEAGFTGHDADHAKTVDSRDSVESQATLASNLRSNFSHAEYLEAVETARQYIAAGDIFQVNISQRFEADLSLPPLDLYRHLRQINPAPFAAYLNFGEVTVLSSSPERFLRLDGDLVESRPMKGTRPRGASPAEDEALRRELMESAKDRAENVMILDLERNDIGRVCHFGTVRVRELWTLEKYATVFQLTSTVEGRLRRDRGRMDLLKACFPGGSITGAPKVRAMEIIDELEPTKRSVYTGSIGYLSFDGGMDLNIAIRTILVKDGKAYFQVGGAVTYDSDPEAEYQETMDKARALFESLNLSPYLPVRS